MMSDAATNSQAKHQQVAAQLRSTLDDIASPGQDPLKIAVVKGMLQGIENGTVRCGSALLCSYFMELVAAADKYRYTQTGLANNHSARLPDLFTQAASLGLFTDNNPLGANSRVNRS